MSHGPVPAADAGAAHANTAAGRANANTAARRLKGTEISFIAHSFATRRGSPGSGRYELPLLVVAAVGIPLHDLRAVVGRRAVHVGNQAAVVAGDGVVAATGGLQ